MHVSPLQLKHLPSVSTLLCAAFLDDSLFEYLCPDRKLYIEYWRRQWFEKVRAYVFAEGVRGLVVLDDGDGGEDREGGDDMEGEGEVMGVAVWKRRGDLGKVDGDVWWSRGDLNSVFERFASDLQKRYGEFFHLDRSIDYRNQIDFEKYSMLEDDATSAFLGDEHIWLGTMAVDPKHQRKGVARKLMQWGIERGDIEGVPIGLYSSPNGAKLYGAVGFVEVGKVKAAGVEDAIMVRWPGGEKREGVVRPPLDY